MAISSYWVAIKLSIETNDPIHCYNISGERNTKDELTAIIENALEGGYWAICPEVPGANGQGKTIEEAKETCERRAPLFSSIQMHAQYMYL